MPQYWHINSSLAHAQQQAVMTALVQCLSMRWINMQIIAVPLIHLHLQQIEVQQRVI